MESLLAKAVEAKLKSWLKSFQRQQFRLLQGRTMLLSNLDLNGKTLHSCLGLPPSLRVNQARVGKLEIQLPSVSNVKSEPVVVSIDRLDVVLAETLKDDGDSDSVSADTSSSSANSSSRNTSYGFSDKVADGVTVNVGELNVMLETLGSAGADGADAASWTPPLASITMRGVMLYTTNEYWQVVNLKDTRQFFHGKKLIYIFKKLEWESLSIDLLPHPKMFSDARMSSKSAADKSLSATDPEDARRAFFGGERLVDNVYGTANITQLRSLHNEPIGLEVELNVSEVLCPALSEPGLRAFLRFLSGLYSCLNRGDTGIRESSGSAMRVLVSLHVDNVFVRIKESDFQLELILQSLKYSRASAGGADFIKSLARLEINGLFFRDTYAQPPCTLVQPSMRGSAGRYEPPPEFARGGFFARVYPLASSGHHESPGLPMFQLFAAQTSPAPPAPEVASHVYLRLQPMKINLQEDSCLRMASLLSDGATDAPVKIVKEPLLKSIQIHLEELDITLPLKDTGPSDVQRQQSMARHGRQRGKVAEDGKARSSRGFTGAQFYVDGLSVIHDPSLKYGVLQMDKDAACFLFWEGQPADNSQWRFAITAVSVSAALETGRCDDLGACVGERTSGLWRCLEVQNPCLEVAMATQDGSPITVIPPPGGVLRVGFKCQQFMSNTSREQLIFVLRMILHMGKVAKRFMKIGKILRKKIRTEAPIDVRQVPEEAQQFDDEEDDEDFDDDDWYLDGSSVGSATESRSGSDNKSVGCARSPCSMPRNAIGAGNAADFAAVAPGDSAVTILVEALELRVLESVPDHVVMEGPLLARIMAAGLGAQAKHRSLEGAAAITWNATWRDIRVELVDTENTDVSDLDADLRALERGGLSSDGIVKFLNWSFANEKRSRGRRGSHESMSDAQDKRPTQPPMKAVLWMKGKDEEEETSTFGVGLEGRQPLLEANMVHVIPYVESSRNSPEGHTLRGKVQVTGVRVGGGMEYNEALLHRFGVLDEDGGPGEAVKRILKILSKKQFSELLRKLSKDPSAGKSEDTPGTSVGMPDELNVELVLVDWAFLLERGGKPGSSRPGTSGGRVSSSSINRSSRYSRHWHMGFRKVQVVADSAAAPSVSVRAERPSRPWKVGRYKSLPIQALTVKVEGMVVVKPLELEISPSLENGANSNCNPPARSREPGLIGQSSPMLNSFNISSPSYPPYSSPAHPGTNPSPSHPSSTSYASPPYPAPYTSPVYGSPYAGSTHSSTYSPPVNHPPRSSSSSQGLLSTAALEVALGKFKLGDHSGIDVEVRLGAREGSGLLGGEKAGVDWVLDCVKVGIKEPVEIEATKAELSNLVQMFKGEIEAAGRIGKGALRLLQRSAPVAQLVVEQLEATRGMPGSPLQPKETASAWRDLASGLFGEDFGSRKRYSQTSAEQEEEVKWRDRVMEAEMMLLKSQSLCFQLKEQLSLGAGSYVNDRSRGGAGGMSELDLGLSRKAAELAGQLESLQALLEKIGDHR